MFEIVLNNTYYDRQSIILEWCWVQFGMGNWGTTLTDGCVWSYDCIFGNTTLFFENEKDLLWFSLVWL